MVAIGEVISIDDEFDGERIKVKIRPKDNIKMESEIDYAYPLLPKTFFVKPKVGEAVFVIFSQDGNVDSQRYYIGPLISQPQFMYKNLYGAGATTLLKGELLPQMEAPKVMAPGAFQKDNSVALIGRKNCDIILNDNDIKIRCGVKILDDKANKISFNKINPSFIQLKYFQKPHSLNVNGENIESVANIVAHKINLISTNGAPYIPVDDKDELINDKNIAKIIQDCHQLPYGDKLVEFLQDFLKLFSTHTHKYSQLPPINGDDISKMFYQKYGQGGSNINEQILSKNIRIN